MQQKLKEMLEIQEKLNLMTNGKDWKDWITNKGKVINWRRCMYMEMSEAIDSLSRAHWRNIEGGIDFENIKIELVDIWHFLMSELLRLYPLEEVLDLVQENMDYEAEIKLPKTWKKEDNLKLNKYLEHFEVFMGMALLPIEEDEFMENFVQEYFVCLDTMWMSFEDLYKLYIWKNILNKFRQDNGYKEGTYIKIWDGKEDNVYMQKIIEQTSGFLNIYKKLEEKYEKLN